jgi:hypothetical protein
MTLETEEEPLSVLKEQEQQPEKSSQKLDWTVVVWTIAKSEGSNVTLAWGH